MISEVVGSELVPSLKIDIFMDVYMDNSTIKRDIVVSIENNKLYADAARLDPIELKRVNKMIRRDDSLKLVLEKAAGKIPKISVKGSLVNVEHTDKCINLMEDFIIEKRDIKKG